MITLDQEYAAVSTAMDDLGIDPEDFSSIWFTADEATQMVTVVFYKADGSELARAEVPV